VLDVSPVGSTTSPLLFEWKELYCVDDPSCEHQTRLLGEPDSSPAAAPCEIRLTEDGVLHYEPLGIHKFPDDAVRWASETGRSLDALLEHLAEEHGVDTPQGASIGSVQ
jgi:hypothetical protein